MPIPQHRSLRLLLFEFACILIVITLKTNHLEEHSLPVSETKLGAESDGLDSIQTNKKIGGDVCIIAYQMKNRLTCKGDGITHL